MLSRFQNILITGGTGTLGRAIVRDALDGDWLSSITIYSRSELRQSEMRQEFPGANIRYVLGDIRDYARLEAATAGHDCVIHAAAMKRIPECETQPEECIATNVLGSANVVRACNVTGVTRCIGISTDKACRAITNYGASKRMMEALFQSQQDSPTLFTLVRYGNVLESNGSVLHAWKRQFEHTGEIVVTDLQMSRFWMSEQDAVNCIHSASELSDGQILIPKVRARKLLDLARVVVPKAKIVVTGLRSMEKLHEDLVHPLENAIDAGAYFILRPDIAPKDISYTSDTAPLLSDREILERLQ